MGNKDDKLSQRKDLAIDTAPDALLVDLRQLIEETRASVAVAVNAGLTLLYWRVGKRISQGILKGDRAEYGKEIVATVSQQLVELYGAGFSTKNIRHMVKFADAFPDEKIVSALRRQLSWTHFKAIIYIEDPLKRDFYAEMCRVQGWSTRTLQKKMDGMLFERTAISKKPNELHNAVAMAKERLNARPEVVS
jgi:hypothetical protein